mgnify:CR=1 FL=1
MSLAYHELKASYAFVERNINLVKRYWGWEVVWMLYTIANSLAVVLIAKGTNSAIGTEALADAQIDAFILFLAIGALVWHYLAVVFQTVSEMISWERWEGTIEYTFMAPVRRGTHMVGTALFSLVYGLLHTAVVLVVIVLVGWPSSLYLFHQVRPRPYSPVQIVLMFGCFASAIVLSLSVWWQSMRSGVRALRQMDRTPA